MVNATLFVLIGLQLRAVVDGLGGYSPDTLAGYAAAVTGVVVVTRVAWFFSVPYLVWAIDRPNRARDVGPAERFVVAWSGMRGAVSLAVALAVPHTTDAGDPFPARDLIVFLTFAVIFFTLVVQGLSLPALISRLHVADRASAESEEVRGRLVAATAALRELDVLASEDWTRAETLERLRRFSDYRKHRFAARAGQVEDEGFEAQTAAYERTLQRLLAAQRESLLRLRDEGDLSNDAMNRILRELDLEASRPGNVTPLYGEGHGSDARCRASRPFGTRMPAA